MKDSRKVREPHLDPLGKAGLRPGCLDHGHLLPVLQLVSLVLLAALLVIILDKGSSSQDEEQAKLLVHEDLKELTEWVEHLCRPCPWDWALFQGNCYFFSENKKTWRESEKACEDQGAQLVVIQTDEEQRFLYKMCQKNGNTWIGLSDLKKEGTRQWMDDSLLQSSFWKYWRYGEPSNYEEGEDCGELTYGGWNDDLCVSYKFWICKQAASSCSKM